jgi:hypothetical protein
MVGQTDFVSRQTGETIASAFLSPLFFPFPLPLQLTKHAIAVHLDAFALFFPGIE